MQVKNKLFCHWDFVQFVSEKYLQQDDGTFLTLSVTEGNEWELMIYLGRDDSNSCYEVRVYKSEPEAKYVRNEYDKVSRYEENDEYATFFFDKYEDALRFTDNIGYLHPEYKKRPYKEITEKF